MYDLSPVLPTDHEVTVAPGTNVLVSGPPMVGKSRLAMDFLVDGYRDGQGALAITTEDRAQTVLERFADRIDDFEQSRLGIVDCRSEEGGSAPEDTPLVKYVASPADLTGIGMGVSDCMNVLDAVGTERNRLALSSLSTMLSYTDRETVFKFCHIMTARAESMGYVSMFTMDADAHDPRTVNMVQRAFDAGIEIRENAGRRELRVVGIGADPSGWRPIASGD